MKNYFKNSSIAKLGAKTQKVFLLIALIGFVSISSVNAQSNDIKNGFIGISLGAAIPMGEDIKENCDVGAQFHLDFGYLLSKGIGIHAQIFGTRFYSKYQTKNSAGLMGLLAGPLFSTTSTGVVEFDFKPAIGYCNGSVFEDERETARSKATFAAGATASLRWNCWRNFSLSGNVIYVYGKPDGLDFSSLGIMVGVNYRLR